MKAHYKTADGRIVFEVQAEDTKQIFSRIAELQEVFEAEKACGCCGGTEIRLVHRVVDDFHYYELRCRAAKCWARFQFGQQRKGGGLFPKRKGEDGKPLPFGGWEKYVRPGAALPAAAGQQHSAGGGFEPSDDDVPF